MRDYLPLLAAAIGLVGGVVITLLTAQFNRRNEASKWLRDQKVQAYVEFSTSYRELVGWISNNVDTIPKVPLRDRDVPQFPDEARVYAVSLMGALTRIDLVASQPVRDAAHQVYRGIQPCLQTVMSLEQIDDVVIATNKLEGRWRSLARKELNS